MHPPKPLPSLERLNEVFRLDHGTGKLFWKSRPEAHCVSRKEFLRWNTRFADTEVGTTQEYGHRRYDLDGGTFYVHRTIWKMIHGTDPVHLIDHRNGKGGDNPIGNLRDVSQAINMLNRKLNKNNILQVRGVYKLGRRYVARMRFRGKHHGFGSYGTIEEAKRAYAAGRLRLTGEAAPLLETV